MSNYDVPTINPTLHSKNQLMMLFLFVILSFMDNEKLKQHQQAMAQRLRRIRVIPGQPKKTNDR